MKYIVNFKVEIEKEVIVENESPIEAIKGALASYQGEGIPLAYTASVCYYPENTLDIEEEE